MDIVEEKVDISITEESNEVKEMFFSIGTGDSGIGFIETDKIMGDLKCILIDSERQIDINMTLGEYDIPLFSTVSFIGVKYLPLRISPISSENERFNFSPVEWTLNDKLYITVKGPKFTTVSFVVRWS